MRRALMLLLLLLSGPVTAWAAPHTIELPAETAQLAPGPNQELASANCSACHSADYLFTQPRGLPSPAAFWTAEVVKMRGVYGAPIEQADVAKLVEYLVAAYGK